MKLPKTIKVGAAIYTITDDEETWNAAVASGEVSTREAWGMTDHTKCIVLIRPGQSLSQAQHTVAHEVLHILFFYGIDWDAVAAVGDKEEYSVGAIEPFFLMFLKDNLDLLGYLLSQAHYHEMTGDFLHVFSQDSPVGYVPGV